MSLPELNVTRRPGRSGWESFSRVHPLGGAAWPLQVPTGPGGAAAPEAACSPHPCPWWTGCAIFSAEGPVSADAATKSSPETAEPGSTGRAEGRGVLRGGQLRAGNPSTRPRPTACGQKQGQHKPSCSLLSPAQGDTDREEVPTVHGRGQPSRCPAGCLWRLPGPQSLSVSQHSLPTRTDGARTVGLSLTVRSPHGAHPAAPSV